MVPPFPSSVFVERNAGRYGAKTRQVRRPGNTRRKRETQASRTITFHASEEGLDGSDVRLDDPVDEEDDSGGFGVLGAGDAGEECEADVVDDGVDDGGELGEEVGCWGWGWIWFGGLGQWGKGDGRVRWGKWRTC